MSRKVMKSYDTVLKILPEIVKHVDICYNKKYLQFKGKIQVERNREMKEKIHALTEEMLENMGRLVAIDSQLGTPEEGKPFGEDLQKLWKKGLRLQKSLDLKQ